MSRIYACYRQDDNPQGVGRVVGDVRSCFGAGSVFHDIDSIPIGGEWPEHLQQELASCDVLLAFIGREWHQSWHDDTGPRLWHPGDWVRLEICTAIDSKTTTVVPILVDDATMPKKTALPPDCSLKKLPELQAIRIRHADYEVDIEKLIKRLGTLIQADDEVTVWQRLSRMQVHQRLTRISTKDQ